MNRNKILVIGDIVTHHRSQIFIQKLMHRDVGSNNNLLLSFANPGFYNSSFQTHGLFSKILRKIFNIIASPLFIVELVFKIPFSDKIYFLPMNHRKFLIVYIVNLIWRKPIVSDFFISAYDPAKDGGLIDAVFFRKLIGFNFAWYLKMLDRLIIERSTKVIFGGRAEMHYLAKEIGADLNKSSLVIIPSASQRKLIANPTNSTIFRICWWGVYKPFHGIENILRSVGLLKERGLNFSLNLFGTPMSDSSKYQALATELGLEKNVFFHTDKTFNNKRLEEYLEKNCDIALGVFSSSERSKRTFPTKIIDSFSMKIPVVSMNTEVIKDYADAENDLFVCDETPESLANLILKISQDKSEMARRAENGYKLYESRFTPEAAQDSFMKVIKDL